MSYTHLALTEEVVDSSASGGLAAGERIISKRPIDTKVSVVAQPRIVDTQSGSAVPYMSNVNALP